MSLVGCMVDVVCLSVPVLLCLFVWLIACVAASAFVCLFVWSVV